MPSPPWREPPDTSHLDEDDPAGMLEAARLRNAWRNVMAIRWRNPKCREQDKNLGRLPEKWHDWMHCPAPEGYGTNGCTCDIWLEKKKRKRYIAPRLRAREEQHAPRCTSPAMPHLNRLVIKTIDLHLGVPILLEHAQDMQGDDEADTVVDQPRSPRAKSRSYCSICPTWLRGRRCFVPKMRYRRRRA